MLNFAAGDALRAWNEWYDLTRALGAEQKREKIS